MADDRDLVFLSYCHRDDGQAEAVRIMLEPALEGTGHALWMDTKDLRAGDRWHPEIDAAVARSRVAVLLVTKDFLASRFVRDHELPALLAHGVRIAPVLVGGCPWRKIDALAGVEWLHDPSEGNALGLFTGAERDRRLNRIVERVLDLLPGDVPAPAPAVPSGPPPVVSPVPVGDRPGPLGTVPELPSSYVERSGVLDGLVAALVERDAVGITGSGVGLYGQGGIGKSVLAAALARDGTVRARFPDGVHWVTVGEHADVLAVQLELLRRLGGTDAPPRTTDDAKTALTGQLRERRVLLVVDDVWTTHAATAFRVTGPRGRVLFTTREPRVLDDVRARRYPVDVLSPVDAGRLAARVLDQPPEELPAAAATAMAEVGHVALAVALLASAVRGGAGWDRISDELRAGADVYGDRPYANAFKAMQIAVARLPDDLARRLFGLAVFAADETIPVRAVARLWAARHGDDAAGTDRALGELAGAALLTLDDGGVALHDLQHAYVVLHGGDPALRHATLLSGYRSLLGPGEPWSSLPPGEPYVWDHLVRHLRGAGEWRELQDTVTDPAFLTRRIQAAGTHAAETDLLRAARALPDRPTIRWWRDWMPRHAAYLSGSDASAATDTTCAIAPSLRAWLEADTGRPPEIDPARLDGLLPPTHLTVRWGLTAPAPALVRTLVAHEGEVRYLAWSPAGDRIVTAGEDGRVQIVDLGTATTTVLTTGFVATSLVWSADGDRIAATGVARRVRCWDASTGTVVVDERPGHDGRVCAWSVDGRFLAWADDETIWVREPGTGTAATAVGTAASVQMLDWSSDGVLLAAINPRDITRPGWVSMVDVWNSADPAAGPERIINTSRHGMGLVRWSPAGTRAIAVAVTCRAVVWSRDDGSVHEIPKVSWSNTAAWSPDGGRVAAVDLFARLLVLEPDTGETVLLGEDHGACAVAWSPDGSRIATAGRDGQIRLWNPGAGTAVDSFAGEPSSVRTLAWAPDGRALAVQRSIRVDVHEPTAGSTVRTHTCSDFAWSPDGTRLALTSVRSLTLWDPHSNAPRTMPTPSENGPRHIAWSADGSWLTTIESDHSVQLVDPRRQTVVRSLAGPTDETPHVAWSPDGNRLAVVSSSEVRIHTPGHPGPVARLPLPGRRPGGLAWSPDGNRLAFWGGPLQVWSPDDPDADPRVVTERAVLTAVWSPDGTVLACNAFADVWIATAGTGESTVLELDRTRNRAREVFDWSPDGRWLAAGGSDGRLQIWERDGDRFTQATRLALGRIDRVAWAPAGLAVAGPWGAAVLDLHDAGTDALPHHRDVSEPS